MERRFRITVDGRPYNVTVEDLDETGAPPAAPWPGTATSIPAAAAVAAPPTLAPAASAGSGPGDVLATLGGVVESVLVSVGQAVDKGETLVVLEAMKMNSPMVAPHSGTVSRVCVKPGEPVEAGHVLATVV